jgi:hypothetical protein
MQSLKFAYGLKTQERFLNIAVASYNDRQF